MKSIVKICVLAFSAAFLIACNSGGGGGVQAPDSSSSQNSSSSERAACTSSDPKRDYSFARTVNSYLGRGINLGNGFDAQCNWNPPNPSEGENGTEPTGGWDNCWSNPIKEEYFALLKEAGFQSIRLPVNWNTRAADEPPYTINPLFSARVKEVVNQAIAAGFPVIINIHHYNALIDAKGDAIAKEMNKFYGLWRQIANEFKGYSNDSLVFELFNEPRGSVTNGRLAEMIANVWPIIRETNPGRIIMINPNEWGHFTHLTKISNLPDEKVILTGHQYFPHEFTHQGVDNRPTGVTWGTEAERLKMVKDIEGTTETLACKFPDVNEGSFVPLNVGEFGSTTNSPEESRVEYNKALLASMDKYNMSWHYWCLTGCQFDIYDKMSKQWNTSVLRSLIPETSP